MDYLAPASASAAAAEEEDAETAAEEEEEEEESESDPVSESEDEPDEPSASTTSPSLRKNDRTQPLLAESFRGALRSLGTCLRLRLVLVGLSLPLRVQLTVHKSHVPQPVVAHVAAVLGVEVTEYRMAPLQPSCRGVKPGELLPDHTERVIRIREDEVPESEGLVLFIPTIDARPVELSDRPWCALFEPLRCPVASNRRSHTARVVANNAFRNGRTRA